MPGEVSTTDIEDMIATVDKNSDGKISYSEFRVMLCIACQGYNVRYCR